MSDMDQSDVEATAATPAAVAAVEAPSAEELQAEIDAEAQNVVALKAQLDALQTPAPPAPPAVPIVTRAPSSEGENQQPEASPEIESTPPSLADAVRALLVFVKDRRVAGDGDLDAALAEVEAALTAEQVAQ